MKTKIAIIGTGAYGTCLANVLADNGHDVMMFGIMEKEINDLNKGLNSTYFSHVPLNQHIRASTDFDTVITESSHIVLAVPVKAIKSVCQQLNEHLKHNVVIINTAKGLNPENGEILSHLIINEIKKDLICDYVGIYGPSIAKEVIERKQTCIMAVSENEVRAKTVAKLFDNDYFHVFADTDVIGAEYGVALKNVIAIASGIFSALSDSDNANASFLTLGLNEIKLIALANGAKANSFFNFACLADLLLTATSLKSRNFSFGHDLVINNRHIKNIELTKTIEGVLTCETIHKVIKKQKIKAPILTLLYEVIFHGADVELFTDIFANTKSLC